MKLEHFSQKAKLDIQNQALDAIFFGNDFGFQFELVRNFENEHHLSCLTPYGIYSYLSHLAQMHAFYPLVSHNIQEYLLYANRRYSKYSKSIYGLDHELFEKIGYLKKQNESLYKNGYLLQKMYQSSFGAMDFMKTNFWNKEDILNPSWSKEEVFQARAMADLSYSFLFTLHTLENHSKETESNAMNENFLRYLNLSLISYPGLLSEKDFLNRIYQILKINQQNQNDFEEDGISFVTKSFLPHNKKLLTRVKQFAEKENIELK